MIETGNWNKSKNREQNIGKIGKQIQKSTDSIKQQ